MQDDGSSLQLCACSCPHRANFAWFGLKFETGYFGNQICVL